MFWRTWKMHHIFSLFLSISILATLFSFAPAAPVKAQTPVVSPEILADGSVTFRYYNPDATSVQLYIENSKNDLGFWCYNPGWPQLDMTLDPTTGVWSITLPPMEPEVYNYHFTILVPPATRPTNIADPANPGWNPDAINSQLYIPGASAAWESVQDVPHGQLQQIFYYSAATDSMRPMAVYTPPGYDKDSRTYPTLYLSHGAGGNDIDWSTQGVANNIVDNLIAQHKIRPMVLVMTNFNGIPGGNDGYRLDLLNSVIPAVEQNYRVNRNPDQRAFAGLSAGGFRAANILVNSPTEFGFIGIWSGAGLTQENLLPNLDAIRDMRGIDMSVGGRDFLYSAMVSSMQALDYYQIPYTGLVTAGDCHTWFFWRRALYEFLTGPLFKIN